MRVGYRHQSVEGDDMDWNQSRVSYYADFALVPILCLAVLLSVPPSASMLATAPLGFVAWTLAEYWIHRSLFHRVMRKQHWLHHIRPSAYVAAPAWLTGLLHVLTAAALVTGLGAAGAGLFLGLEAGYVAYVATHDAIHHRERRGPWLQSKWAHHRIHHQGAEVNFGVVTHFWDHRFGTYWNPAHGRPLARRAT